MNKDPQSTKRTNAHNQQTVKWPINKHTSKMTTHSTNETTQTIKNAIKQIAINKYNKTCINKRLTMMNRDAQIIITFVMISYNESYRPFSNWLDTLISKIIMDEWWLGILLWVRQWWLNSALGLGISLHSIAMWNIYTRQVIHKNSKRHYRTEIKSLKL